MHLREYVNPQAGAQGNGRDLRNLDYWSKRATENSKVAPRASDSGSAPAQGRGDKNHVGGTFLKGVRRTVGGA